LQAKYASQVEILIGFEAEWIRPTTEPQVHRLLLKHRFDLFIGSVHHTHTIPIDFDKDMYHKARDIAGGTDERLFEDYFDAQYDMVQKLVPPVVGHFDLIRLYSDEPDRSMVHFKGVWHRIMRNLKYIAAYGGLLELNSSALRKDMKRQYPTTDICKVG
jgi:histidinol-phosphatase (PHP family)